MNDLGLGVVVSMKDAFSRNAMRVQSSMQSLDASVAAASERMTRNLDRIQKGTMMIGAGLALLAVPAVLITSRSFEKTTLELPCAADFEKGRAYDMVVVINPDARQPILLRGSSVPVK